MLSYGGRLIRSETGDNARRTQKKEPGQTGPVPPVLLIGAHRSGTTATAGALQVLGLEIGKHLDSHHESRPLQQLHENYLRQVGASWFQPLPFLEWIRKPDGMEHCAKHLRENFDLQLLFEFRRNPADLIARWRLKRGKPWGWKEPRTTLFAPCWLRLFPEARILHIVRHPLAVAKSMQQRELEFQKAGDAPSGQLHDLQYCLRLAASYIEAGELLRESAPHYRMVRFEEIQQDPGRSLAQLAAYCGLPPSQDRMREAAATIRPQVPAGSDSIARESWEQFLAEHPAVAALGYE